jgi:hypothetical protein
MSKKRRAPQAGGLAPHQLITLMIDPPIAQNEQPVLLTPNPPDLLMDVVNPSSVTLTNQTDHLVGYLFMVVPVMVTKLAMLPWAKIIAAAKQPDALAAGFQRFLRRYLPPTK